MKRIRINGGGLAGLSLGIALSRKGVPVEIAEAGRYPRHRVCGEFITGMDPSIPHSLGIDDCLGQAVALSTVAVFVGNTAVLNTKIPRPAWGISRWKLDAALAALFRESGGNLMTGVRGQVDKANPEGTVYATGRVPGGKKRGWVGLKGHLHETFIESDLELHLGNNGYAGISRIENGVLNLCGLFRPLQGKNLRGPALVRDYLLRNGLTRLAERMDHARVDESSFCAVSALDYGLFKSPGPDFSLGDTWALIPPFTGNGMSLAFEGAHAAVEPLTGWAEGRLNWASCTRSFRAQRRRQALWRIIRAKLLHEFLLSGSTRKTLSWMARREVLPFGWLYNLTH